VKQSVVGSDEQTFVTSASKRKDRGGVKSLSFAESLPGTLSVVDKSCRRSNPNAAAPVRCQAADRLVRQAVCYAECFKSGILGPAAQPIVGSHPKDAEVILCNVIDPVVLQPLANPEGGKPAAVKAVEARSRTYPDIAARVLEDGLCC
jgi:hypothetical protein